MVHVFQVSFNSILDNFNNNILTEESDITCPEVDSVSGEPLDGPGVVIDNVLLGLGVAPAVTGDRGEFAHVTR